MADYKQSSLWQSAFSHRQDGYDDQRDKLVGAYDDFRSRVSLLVAQIQKELPALTLHDITHVDALWHVASEIAGPDFPLNPSEALVLGGSFLLHDAAHCRAAFPGGLEEIRSTVEWRDAAAERGLDPATLVEGSETFQVVLFETLRVLHPKRARGLASAEWNDGSVNRYRLFPHDELREAYGSVIGEIAESHWFSPHELEIFSKRTVTAPSYLAPASWTVDLFKVAILLRVADASHIDAKRAPRLLLALNRPGGVSRDHWRFQARLNQATCDAKREELIFSGSPFPKFEQTAWWLAYDAACLADRELSAADHLLRDHGLPRLRAREVAGVRTPESYAKYVPTDGWHPIDASLRISDIKSLVERFGGEKLYGDEPYLALRELLQNARDAVIACRALGGLAEDEGRITVELEEIAGEDWLHVTDTGIGMSRFVLIHVLLDFGRSLWRDPGLRREWPGLAASSFAAVGQFGIGFFSVFMLGDHVKITTRRYTQSQTDESPQWVLEFSNGVDARPSLREPGANEGLPRHGTRVSVRLTKKARLFSLRRTYFDIFSSRGSRVEVPLELDALVGALAPSLDIDVYTKVGRDEKKKTISAGDWRTIEPKKLFERIAPGTAQRHPEWMSDDLNVAAKNLSLIRDHEGRVLGRCAVVGRSDSIFGFDAGIVTVGGLFGGLISGVAGIFVGRQADRLDRSVAIPIAEEAQLSTWADSQAERIRTEDRLSWRRSSALLALGANHDELHVIYHGREPWTARRFREELACVSEVWLIEDRHFSYDSETDEVMRHDFESHLQLDSRLFVLQSGMPMFGFIREVDWPAKFSDGRPTQPAEVIERVVNQVWPDALSTSVTEGVIGTVSGVQIKREITVVTKTSRSTS